MNDQSEIPVSYPMRFKLNQELKHTKGGVYTVVGLPDTYVLEHSREPAYAYRMKDGRICVRCQSEMEDGRFIPMEKSEGPACHISPEGVEVLLPVTTIEFGSDLDRGIGLTDSTKLTSTEAAQTPPWGAVIGQALIDTSQRVQPLYVVVGLPSDHVINDVPMYCLWDMDARKRFYCDQRIVESNHFVNGEDELRRRYCLNQHKTRLVIVNGRETLVNDTISYEQLVRSSKPGMTVVYTNRQGNKSGSLTVGESIDVEDGMIFNVANTSFA